ncbi:MAG TPA: formyltransferase family protein [Allosphingosinicella sp.]
MARRAVVRDAFDGSMGATLCIAGKSQAAVDVLNGSLGLAERVVCLPNRGDDGVDGWQPSLLRAAAVRDIEIVSLDWAMAQPDLVFVSIEYDRILRVGAFASRRLFNLHFSLLPKYRGCNTAIWPILNGEREHGVTLHEIDAGIDTGPIVAQRAFSIDRMTSRQVYGRCLGAGAELVLEWLPRILSADYVATPQDEAVATHYPRDALDFGLKEISLDEPAAIVMRRIRAFTFPEYQHPTFGGRPIVGAESEHGHLPVRESPVHSVRVAAADGDIRLHLQLGSAMSGRLAPRA